MYVDCIEKYVWCYDCWRVCCQLFGIEIDYFVFGGVVDYVVGQYCCVIVVEFVLQQVILWFELGECVGGWIEMLQVLCCEKLQVIFVIGLYVEDVVVLLFGWYCYYVIVYCVVVGVVVMFQVVFLGQLEVYVIEGYGYYEMLWYVFDEYYVMVFVVQLYQVGGVGVLWVVIVCCEY